MRRQEVDAKSAIRVCFGLRLRQFNPSTLEGLGQELMALVRLLASHPQVLNGLLFRLSEFDQFFHDITGRSVGCCWIQYLFSL